MSQSDCLKILEEKKIWVSVQYIKKILKINTVSENLRKIHEQGIVEKSEFISKDGRINYMFKLKNET